MTFDECVEIILQLEGGYSCNPDDPGRETKWGISKRAFPQIRVKDLSRDDAKSIYRTHYWAAMRLDEMPGGARLAIFDCAVNQGSGRAITFLQKTVGCEPDGKLGPDTLGALQKMPLQLFLANFIMRRFEAYSTNPLWFTFGRGWSKRLLDIALRSTTELIEPNNLLAKPLP